MHRAEVHSPVLPTGGRERGRRATADDRGEAVRVGNEVETLYTNGPSGGGGASKSVRQVVAVASLLLPRDKVNPRIEA